MDAGSTRLTVGRLFGVVEATGTEADCWAAGDLLELVRGVHNGLQGPEGEKRTARSCGARPKGCLAVLWPSGKRRGVYGRHAPAEVGPG